MRIALVTESFAPRTDETADTARHLADGLIAAGHDLMVIAPGPGRASHCGAHVVRTRRVATPRSIGPALDGFGAEFLIAMSPAVLGSSALLDAGAVCRRWPSIRPRAQPPGAHRASVR